MNDVNNNILFEGVENSDVLQIQSAPEKEIGVDTNNQLFSNIVNAGMNNTLDMSTLESFTTVSQRRDQLYGLIATMCQDSTVAAILEVHAEDATEYNDSQQIVWVTSDDDKVCQYVSYLLDKINVDKHVFEWVLNLCKYGDIYLRLYRQSEYEDERDIFATEEKRKALKEAVKIQAFSKEDHYSHYVEMMPNPAEYYELTKHGKTYGFIKAPVLAPSNFNTDANSVFTSTFNYNFNQRDITVYDATQFVHAALYDSSSRTPEEVSISTDDSSKKYTYKVKRGQSLFYNVFKIWRELRLLETAILLNRITKSSVVRIIQVEVGAMDKNMVGPHLVGIKQMFEQKAALDTDKNMTEYNNPGPTENNIYVPTRNGIGAIQVQNVGGDNTNVTGLADLDYFKNKFYGAFGIPKAFMGDTDDSAGFNGGESLAILSSRFAKRVKRIQATMTQAITDIINLMLVDADLDAYVNKFTIHMLAPTTKEALDRRDNTREKVGIIQDIMNILSDVDNSVTKLKILKALLADTMTDNEVVSLLQEEIEAQENEDEEEEKSPIENLEFDSPKETDKPLDLDAALGLETEEPKTEVSDEIILPRPSGLNKDFTEL